MNCFQQGKTHAISGLGLHLNFTGISPLMHCPLPPDLPQEPPGDKRLVAQR